MARRETLLRPDTIIRGTERKQGRAALCNIFLVWQVEYARTLQSGRKSFGAGSRGSLEPVSITKPQALNLTAYAIGDRTNLYVTIINKEHGAESKSAAVTVLARGLDWTNAQAMFLTASDGAVGATNGVTLGGATITNNAPWQGQWTALNPAAKGECTVMVPAASAAIVKLSSRF